jgi:hypothetical protein
MVVTLKILYQRAVGSFTSALVPRISDTFEQDTHRKSTVHRCSAVSLGPPSNIKDCLLANGLEPKAVTGFRFAHGKAPRSLSLLDTGCSAYRSSRKCRDEHGLPTSYAACELSPC